MADAGKCYVETDDRDYCGHYRIRNARLARHQFRMEFGSRPVKQITVSFTATDREIRAAKRVLKIMIPDLELTPARS